MGYHIQELGWNGTVKDEISIEQLYFLHSLPSLESRAWCRFWFRATISIIILISWSRMRIWTICGIVRLENWCAVLMVEVWVSLTRAEVIQRVLFVGRRLVWRLIVLVVMFLRV